MSEIKIPLDFEGWPEFRMLEKMGRAQEFDAFKVWMRLWVELGQQAPATGKVGWLLADAVDLFKMSLVEPGGRAADGIFDAVVSTRLLRLGAASQASAPAQMYESPPDYFCSRFAQSNAHLEAGHKPMHLRAADMSKFMRAQQKLTASLAGQALLIPTELFKDDRGVPLVPEVARRVVMLIRTLDNAFMKPERAQYEFSEGLIQDAWRVVAEFTDDAINEVARALVRKRGHAVLPQNTEKALPLFEEMARQLVV